MSDFFTRHPRFVQVDISAHTAGEQRRWFGWCESRLRLLMLSLEQVCAMQTMAMCATYQLDVDVVVS